MDALIARIVNYFVRSEVIDRDDAEIYEYGLYFIISDIIDFSLTFLAAFLINAFPQTILYYVAFIGLRRCAGGYHASTRMRCFVISMITWLVSMMLIRLTASSTTLSVVFALISCVIIWLYSPVENSNNPHTPEELSRMRKTSQVYVIILAMAVVATVVCIPCGVPAWVSSSLAYGMIFFAGSLSVAKVLKEKTRIWDIRKGPKGFRKGKK
jgi:accessory gene regulator B